jgi:HEAT repeat protein
MPSLLAAMATIGPAQTMPQAEDRYAIRPWPLYEQCTSEAGARLSEAALADLKAPEVTKREAAVRKLLAGCSPEAVPLLIEALRDSAAAVRIAAIEVLGQLRHPDAVEPLVELAYDEDWHIRAALTRTLASYQVYRASNVLLNIIVNPGDKRIITDEGDLRARCIGLLMVNQLRDVRFSRKAIGFLFGFLDYEQPALRQMAVEAAAGLKETRNGYHELIGIIKQHNVPDFRLKSSVLLGQWRLVEARDVLTETAAGDKSPAVRKAAADALAAIGAKQ